jgi:uncharacterized protein (DUF2147 family)
MVDWKMNIGVFMKMTLSLLAIILLSALALAKQGADDIIGKWKTEKGGAWIEIYKSADGSYQGKIIKTNQKYGKDETLQDKRNPDPSKRERPIIGLVILKDLRYDGEAWNGGKVYDPERGREFDCKIWLEDNKTLKLRGYVGVPMIGQTETWQRIE